MAIVNMNSDDIRRIFRSRMSFSTQRAPKELERRAAASVVDRKDAVASASPADPLPLWWEIQTETGIDGGISTETTFCTSPTTVQTSNLRT